MQELGPKTEKAQDPELVQQSLDIHATAYTPDGQIIHYTVESGQMIQTALPLLFDEKDDGSDETPTDRYFRGDY